jgi:hypothetical protein
VLAGLARTLSAAQAIPGLPDDPTALTEARDRLNSIAQALHAPIGTSGETGFSVLARQARYIGTGAAPPSFKSDGLATLTNAHEKSLCDLIGSYGALLTQSGPPTGHPLRGVRRLDLQPVDLSRLSVVLTQAQERIAVVTQLIEAAIAAAKLSLPPSIAIVAPLLDLLDRLTSLPGGAGSLASQLGSVPDKARLAEALGQASTWSEERNAAADTFVEEAFSTPLSPLRAPIVAGDASFFRRWGSQYRKASSRLAGLLRGNLPKAASDRLALIDILTTIQEMRARWGEDEAYCASVLGDFWRGERTDFTGVRAIADWCRSIGEGTLQIAADWAVNLAMASGELAGLARALRQAEPLARQALDDVTELLGLDPATLGAANIEDADLREVTSRFQTIANAIDRYGEWIRLNQLRTSMERLGVSELAAHMDSGALDGARAVIELRFARAERLWREALEASSELRGIGSLDRHQLVARFAHLDRERLKDNVNAIRALHLTQVPQGAMGEMRVIRGEIGKKRAHIALRKLFAAAPNAIQRIKPVLLMSPISVAQFLPPTVLKFDPW